MPQVVKVPTINDNPDDFEALFTIRDAVIGHGDVQFDFSSCNFLRPNAVAFLGGLARLIESQQRQVSFAWHTVTDTAVLANLCQNGFAKTFNYEQPGWEGNSIPYREDTACDVTGIIDYLEQYWLGRGWLQVSSYLRNVIVGHMWEIYNNAFEHSSSDIGVFTCGQHFPNRFSYGYETLTLTVIDFGLSIPSKIKAFFSDRATNQRAEQLSDASCLRWAFGPGNTTKVNEVGGIGLDLLHKFIVTNQGKLEIYSNNGYAIIDHNGARYKNYDIAFKGTIVHITLNCDEKFYHVYGDTELW